jgi:pimeloyl-ACP methyl ester carboxylesterase
MAHTRTVQPATHRARGLVLTEHEFELPVDHDRPDGESLIVFAREVVARQRAADDLPWLVFFQGGPGFEAARPFKPSSPTWLERALEDYRVLLLDQRGTGRSTPVGTLAGMSVQEQVDYLKHFRADGIVRDAELIRGALGIERWSVLGQSFGGFCVTRYLSASPEGLAEAFLTGGLPPLEAHPDDIYRATYRRMLERNRAYYERYPQDRERVRGIVERLDAEEVQLPSGDRLTSRRFRALGNMLGMSDGFERLHYIVELPVDSPAFLHDAEGGGTLSFARNPIYAVLHEGCYGQGFATRWSADRVLPDEFRGDPTLFTGEHVFPWMFEDYGALRPLREAADLLAEHLWPQLYDVERLARNDVPGAAAIYSNDLYVEREYSEDAAATIRGLHTWVTSEYEHDGLRADGGRVLGRLIDLVRGDL